MGELSQRISFIADPRTRQELYPILSSFLNEDLTLNDIEIGDATTGLTLSGAYTTAMLVSGTSSADHISLTGVAADGIHISGAMTASALHISGDQVIGILYDVTAAATDGLKIAVPTGITLTTGINLVTVGTGVITTAIQLTYTASATEGVAMTVATTKTLTTGMSMSGAGTYTNGILLDATAMTTPITISAGAITDGILISGTTPVDGIHISSSCSATAINLSGTNLVGITIAGTHTTGITLSAGSMTDAVLISGTTPVDGIHISSACSATGINLSAINAVGISITGLNTTAAMQIGATGAPGGDLIWWGTTASYKVTFDADGDTNGSVLIGADTFGLMFNLYGDVTGCGVFWDPSTDTNGTLSVGASGGSKGVDFFLYGDTNAAFVQWDRSTDDLIISGAAGLLVSSGILSVGADTVAGTITLYSATTVSGTTTITMNDNSGDTVTNLDVAVQGGARTYTIPDTGESASSFLMTDLTVVWWPFAIGLAGEDTDGVYTNSGGLAGSVPDSTTNEFNDSGGSVFCKVYDKGTTTWDDLSTTATLAGYTANYQLQPDAGGEEADDAFAIGFATKFCEFAFDDLSTGSGALATWTNDGSLWEYSKGADVWGTLVGVMDNTDLTAQDGLRTLQRIGVVSFAPPSDWATDTIDGQLGYWIRSKITATVLTQSALIDTTNKDEPFIIVGGTDSFDAPFKCSITRLRATDMGVTVHDQAIKFILCNFTTADFSTEMTWTASVFNDTWTLGSAMACAAGDLLGVLITDDGGSTVNPVMFLEMELSLED